MAPRRLSLRGLPLESSAPVVWFAAVRLVVTAIALGSVIVLGFPYEGQLTAALAVIALPWAALLLLAAQRAPSVALHPLVAAGDFAVLAAVETIVPETYGAVRFVALFLVAAHAHFQGERVGLAVAAVGTGSLVLLSALARDPLDDGVVGVYESVFVVSALGTAAVIGGLRTAESAGRLRARELARRTIAAEDAVRRRIAVSIHDGPVQELVSLEMMLTAARQAGARGDAARAADLLGEAERIASRNVRALRDEIVALGPHAFQELSFETALEDALPRWRRRYGVEIELDAERVDLGSDLDGALFRIAQEAVANAGRHAGASRVDVRLRARDGEVELTVADDGRGFADGAAAPRSAPGHLGLASMRERAESVGGRLDIDSGAGGTVVRVVAPREGG